MDKLAEMSKKVIADNALTAAVVPNTSTLLSHSRSPYLAGRENHTMIYVKRAHLNRYLGLCPALDTAIRHLVQTDLSALAPGRNENGPVRSP